MANGGTSLDSAEVRIRLLEEALADYAARYGLTERARALLVPPPSPHHLAGLRDELAAKSSLSPPGTP